MISFCAVRQAKSYNARKHKMLNSYMQDIADKFTSTGQRGFDDAENLYARVYYFHQRREVADADNISKPIIDALKGHAYKDDKQVIFRSAACLDMRENFDIDFTDLSTDIVGDISRAILEGKSAIYIEVGKYSDDFIQFGVKPNDTI